MTPSIRPGIPDLDERWFARLDGTNGFLGIHGRGHTLRVWTHARALADELGLAAEECEALHFAATWHDIGRTDDGYDPLHGTKSVTRVLELGLDAQIADPRVSQWVLFAVTHHCLDDDYAEQVLRSANEPAAALRVFRVLKDADALDRVRLGDLDERYLRHDVSRARVECAWHLLDELP